MWDVHVAYKFRIVPPNSGQLTPMYMSHIIMMVRENSVHDINWLHITAAISCNRITLHNN